MVIGNKPIFFAIDAALDSKVSAPHIWVIKPGKIIDDANSIGANFLLKCAPPDAGEPYAQGRCRKDAAT
jgi:hypothetical protein